MEHFHGSGIRRRISNELIGASVKQFTHHLILGFILLLGLSSAQAADKVLYSGKLDADFRSWGSNSLEGDWRISERGGKKYIQLLDNFDAKEGPDVKIFLSKQEQASITGDNASKGAVFISLVSTFEGSSEYEIPSDLDVRKFKTLVFHCEAYSKLWGSSQIQ